MADCKLVCHFSWSLMLGIIKANKCKLIELESLGSTKPTRNLKFSIKVYPVKFGLIASSSLKDILCVKSGLFTCICVLSICNWCLYAGYDITSTVYNCDVAMYT